MGGVTWRKGGGGGAFYIPVCAVHTRLTLYRALGGPRAGTRAIHIMYLHIATAEVVITETEEREREREREGRGGGGGGGEEGEGQ